MNRNRNSAIGGLVFSIGLLLGLLGYVGDVYSSSVATLSMLGVWLVGGAIARLFTGDSEESTEREKEFAGRH
jgi:hypothetical protein